MALRDGDPYAIAKTLGKGAEVHRDSAKLKRDAKKHFRKMLSKTGTGHLYTTLFFTNQQGVVIPYGERPPHRASKPGEPPAPDTGALRDSIEVDVMRSPSGMDMEVLTRDPKARYLEYGTRRMKPRPFFRPAMKLVVRDFGSTVRSGVEKRERREARRLGGEG